MRLTDRLLSYLEFKNISVYAFEKNCEVANGYLGKQMRGKGTVGSDILEKIADKYPDLNLVWLITGKGKMLQKPLTDKKSADAESMVNEEATVYKIKQQLIDTLKAQLKTLEAPASKRKKRKSNRS